MDDPLRLDRDWHYPLNLFVMNSLAKRIYENNAAKGFWDKPRNVGEVFMLIITELSEALEAHRKGKFSIKINNGAYFWTLMDPHRKVLDPSDPGFKAWFEELIKDGFEDEIADTYIRILDAAGGFGIQLPDVKAPDIEYRSVDLDNVGDRLIDICDDLIETKNRMRRVEGAGVTLVTALRKLEHLAKDFHFDLMSHVELKLAYNLTRERMHGKKY